MTSPKPMPPAPITPAPSTTDQIWVLADDAGRDATLLTPPAGSVTPVATNKLAELGREVTLQPLDGFFGGRPPKLTGREATLGVPGAGLTGREATLGTDTPLALSGREATTLDAVQALDELTGREATTPTPIDLGGRDLTPGRDTPLTAAGRVGGTPTPATAAGTGRPRTGTATSVSFDDAWHLEGRKGPFTGENWGDFDIGGVLGEGGMGAVYRAKQRSLKRRVAIKVLPPNLAADFRLLQRFQLEARTSSMLNSAHVVAVYAVGEHDGNHFYAMEYVQGQDLYDILKDRRDQQQRFTNDECVSFILQAAKGLVEAARHGVVHRDIKPPNLMVNRDGTLKITDFGIAKLVGEHNLTMTGQAVGTPAYVSPEQGRGDGGIDARSDLYSLGVVFYELATLQKPFKGTTPNALIYQHCYDEPELPKKLNPDLSDEVQALIMRCLQKKPENRYQSAEELVRDLEAIRTGSMLKSALATYKLGTGADEAKREQMNWVQRHLLPVALAASLTVVAGGAAGWWWLDRRATAASSAQRQELDRQKLTIELIPRLNNLDLQQPLYPGVEADLASYAKLKGEDESYQKWQRKVLAVRALEGRLALLDQADAPVFTARQKAGTDLAEYQQLVGTGDAQGARWGKRLADLDNAERQLRDAMAEQFDRNRIDLATHDDTAAKLTRLTAMTATGDKAVAGWAKALATFDSQVATQFTTLEPLSDAAKPVVDRQRSAYRAALDRLRDLHSPDPRLVGWNDRLAKAGGLIDGLRSEVNILLAKDVVPEPELKTAELKIVQYRPLVEEGDADLKRWGGLIDASRQAILARRTELADSLDGLGKDGKDAALPVPQVGPQRERVAILRPLVPAGDRDLIRWDNTVQASAATHTRLATELAVLDPARPEPISLAAQASLGRSLERYLALGGLTFDQAQVYRDRIAAERRRIDTLRERLHTYDQAATITHELHANLDRLALDAGQDDTDVKRWRAKQDRVDLLRVSLLKLDERQGLPEHLSELIAAYEVEVGKNDPDLARWRGKIERIAALDHELIPLDRLATAIPGNAVAALREYEELVGSADKSIGPRRAKVEEAAALRTALMSLPAVRVLGDQALATATAQIQRLVTLVGASEADVQLAARRIAELAGPESPVWAAAHGRDQFGAWVTCKLAGKSLRLRWIAPGRAMVGSPADEVGRDADEVQVPMVLAHGLWLAESECTQAVWQAVMGTNPSRTPGAERPVERVSWQDAEAFLLAANANVAAQGLPKLRLPSEVEWELACRTGVSGPWADAVADPQAIRIAWSSANTGNRPHEVAQRYPNAQGLYDMHGNVWEWCADGYVPYPTTETVDRIGLGGERKVLRGGSCGDKPALLRAANRVAADADLHSAFVGFRIAMDAGWVGEPDGAKLLIDPGQTVRAIEIPFGAGVLVKVQVETRTPVAAAAAAPVAASEVVPEAVPEVQPAASNGATVENSAAEAASPVVVAIAPIEPQAEPVKTVKKPFAFNGKLGAPPEPVDPIWLDPESKPQKLTPSRWRSPQERAK